MLAKPAIIEKLVRKGISLANLGRRVRLAHSSTSKLVHRVTELSSDFQQISHTFETQLTYGNVNTQSLLVIMLDTTEVFRARIGPAFPSNPERVDVETMAEVPVDWLQRFMALDVYPRSPLTKA